MKWHIYNDSLHIGTLKEIPYEKSDRNEGTFLSYYDLSGIEKCTHSVVTYFKISGITAECTTENGKKYHLKLE